MPSGREGGRGTRELGHIIDRCGFFEIGKKSIIGGQIRREEEEEKVTCCDKKRGEDGERIDKNIMKISSCYNKKNILQTNPTVWCHLSVCNERLHSKIN